MFAAKPSARAPLDLELYPTEEEARTPPRFAPRPFLSPRPHRFGSLGATVARLRARDAAFAVSAANEEKIEPLEPSRPKPQGHYIRRVEVAVAILLAVLIATTLIRAKLEGRL